MVFVKNIAELLNDLIEKKTQIEQFKVDHPEMLEAIQVVGEYMALFEEICMRCEQNTPNYIPYPVIYPYNPLTPLYQWICVSNTTCTPRMI